MTATTCDFAVIGGGSAGYAAASVATDLGLRTVVIDSADELGGLCILRGCMPSKTLIESANRALAVKRAPEFGIPSHSGAADTPYIQDRKRRLISEFADYRVGQLESGNFELIRGAARFVSPREVEVALGSGGSSRIEFGTALIATGSVISLPRLDGLEQTGFWTSDTLLDAAEIPDSFIVLGGGATAVELAHFLDGIGRRVTIIQRGPQFLSGTDADLAGALEQAFRARGMAVFTGTELLRIERSPLGKRAVFKHQGTERSADAAEILVSLGRRPAIDGLGLDAAGVVTKNGSVVTTPAQQTSQPHIFAAGDVCSPFEVVHIAIEQGGIAARNASALRRGSAPVHRMDYRLKMFGVFTQPQIAAVGLGERDAAREGRDILVAKYPFGDHGKSMVLGELDGFVKLLGDPRTGEILGGAVIGPHATELIHEITVAMHFRAAAGDLLAIPHYHPTLSEIWTYPAGEIAETVAPASRQ